MQKVEQAFPKQADGIAEPGSCALVDVVGGPLRARMVHGRPPRRLDGVDLPKRLPPAEQLVADHCVCIHILQEIAHEVL